MASLRLRLWEDKRVDASDTPIYLVLRHKNRRATLFTGHRVNPRYWNDRKEEVRRGHPHWRRINDHLARLVEEARGIQVELVTDGHEPWPQDVKAALEATQETPDTSENEDASEDFLAYCDGLLSTWEGRWAYQTFLAYQTAVRKLRDWHGQHLAFEEVTPSLLRRFQAYLAEPKPNGMGNKPNTIHKNLSTLKEFYRQAMEDEVIPWGRNPFDSLTLSKEQAVKEKLTTDELKALLELEMDEKSLMADVRRWFFFAFYAGGMRFSDVAELERRHLEIESGATQAVRVRYRMGKTKGLHAVLVVPEAIDILDYYGWRTKGRSERVFPILDGYDLSSAAGRRKAIASRNALANKYLRKMAKRAGIEKPVSFHLSRHSVAGYLLEKGYDVRTIQRVLGHASVLITESYLKGFRSGGPDAASQSLSL